ncbi:MAG: translocation/assembly module TamB domain-containing protein [Deltaproteobacteria bacterium]|nr:translocation/assembly module TamB domain-containing protein [Deltaproteobacteria bacterium]
MLRYLVRALIGLLILLIVVIAGVTIYVRTDSFDHLLVREVNAALRGRFRGQVTIGAIQTPRLGVVDLHDLAIIYQGRELLRVPLVRASYALIPILWHQVNLTITIDQPRVSVARERNGAWDLAEALQSVQPSSSGPSAYIVTITALELNDGAITLAPNGLDQPQYHVSAANLDARVALLSSGLRVDARKLSAHLEAPQAPPADLTLAAAYDASSQPAVVTLSSMTLATQNSSLIAMAKVTNPSSPTINAHMTIIKLAPADLTRIHGYPLRDNIGGSIDVSGALEALHMIIALSAGPARIELTAGANLKAKQPAYHGNLTLANLDLGRLALGPKLAGHIDTTAQVNGIGSNLATLSASVKADGRGLVINQIRAGNANLAAETKDGRAKLMAAIASGPNRIDADATMSNFAAPSIHAQVATRHVDLQALTGSRRRPKSDLNATLTLDAPRLNRAQLDVAHLDAHILLSIARTTLQNVVIDNGALNAGLHGGVVHLTRMNVNTEGAVLDAHGRIGLLPHTNTQVTYALTAPRLAPLLQLMQLKGDGSLELTGTADGTIAGAGSPSLHVQGRTAVTRLTLNNISATNAAATFDLSRAGQGEIPLGHAKLQLAQIALGTTHLRTLDIATQFTRQNPATLTLVLAMIDAEGRLDSASLNLATQGGNVSGALTHLAITAPDGVWRLMAPAHFMAGPRMVTIDQFDVHNGRREFTLNGTMHFPGPQAISLTVRDFDLSVIQPLLQPNQYPAGTVGAKIEITGTAAAPVIRASLTGQALTMSQQRIGDLNADAAYNPGTANLKVTLYQDPTHQMALTGMVPVTLDWAHGFHLHLGNDLALRLYSAGLRLGGLAVLAPPRMINHASGQLAFDIAISGQPTHPAANGTITLDNLGVEVLPLGLKINNSFAHMRITPTLFTLERMVINAGDGSITAAGTVALTNYAPGAINLKITIHQFPAIHNQRYQAMIAGALLIDGTSNAPAIAGRVEVLNATIHPDLAFLTATKYSRDETIVVIRPGEKPPPTTATTTPAQSAAPTIHSSIFDRMSINVAIIIHRDTWIRHPDASVELTGHIKAVKLPGGPLRLVGEVDTVRGWITFNNQTFTLASGQILFTGGDKIDPLLNIDAQYTVSQYVVDVLVTGFASKPQLKLESNPPLPKADILSLLLFGTTSSSLGQGQSALLQQRATNMAAGAAASTIGQALSSSLGLQDLGISLNGAAGSGGVSLGRYIGKNTYISATQSTTGRKASIQYYISRWISITTSTNSDGSSEIFLNLTRQY